ncbi:orotidine-5'-phosphate decarboxylase [Idiomarina seosinensis]|uniref:orotidine-5'-phosphate decarboxylase n=1 Tax=Idiomarina seosinensis TaxID=281739 RepID=UPI00384C78EF
MNLPKIYVALDYHNRVQADAMVSQLDPQKVGIKVGKELFTTEGPDWVTEQVDKGFSVFLDLKFHDIPNTVAKAVAAAARLHVDIVNVHASGGVKMMQAAKQALSEFEQPPLLIAVTVLTSMDDDDLVSLGVGRPVNEQVVKLAKLSQQAGLDGVVCSAKEAQLLRAQLGSEFKLMTPGIRPASADKDDQKRTLTPAEAVACGVDFMVIGRPITQADNPHQAVLDVINEINPA